LSKSTVTATLPPVAGVSMMPTGIFLVLYFLMTLTMAWLSIGSLITADGLLRSIDSHCWSCVVLSKLAFTAWNRQRIELRCTSGIDQWQEHRRRAPRPAHRQADEPLRSSRRGRG